MTENNPYKLTEEQAVRLASQKRRGIVPQDAVKPLPILAFDPLEYEEEHTVPRPYYGNHTVETEVEWAIRRARIEEHYMHTPEGIYVDVCIKILTGQNVSRSSTEQDSYTELSKSKHTIKKELETKHHHFKYSHRIERIILQRVYDYQPSGMTFEEFHKKFSVCKKAELA